MRGDLAELVAHARWFVTRLNTNGIKMTPALAASLKDAGLDSVQFTFYSADEQIHDSLVGGEHYKETLAGIKNALEAGLDVSVNTPLSRSNADYTATLELLHSIGVRFVTLSGLICTGNAKGKHEEDELSEGELFDIVKHAKDLCTRNEMEMDFTSPGLISKELLEQAGINVPMCGAALSNMAIAPDGKVIPCQSWLGEWSELGSILTDDFSDIWNSEKCISLRSMSEEQALCCPFREEG